MCIYLFSSITSSFFSYQLLIKTPLREPWISNVERISQAIELQLFKHARTKKEYLNYTHDLESYICKILQKRIDKLVKKKIDDRYDKEWEETLECLRTMPTETSFVPETTTVTYEPGTTKLTLNVHKRQKID